MEKPEIVSAEQWQQARDELPSILDLTVYGRQEDWEDSPAGWPQHPTYG